jgi:hypothetical protein
MSRELGVEIVHLRWEPEVQMDLAYKHFTSAR